MFKKYILLSLLVSFFYQPELLAQTKEQTKKESKKDYGKSFFEKDSIHVIRISFTQCSFWDSLTLNKKLMDSLEMNNYMQANVIIDNKKFYSSGVRFKGESSYDFYPGKKKPFRLKFNKFIKGQDLDRKSVV